MVLGVADVENETRRVSDRRLVVGEKVQNRIVGTKRDLKLE